MKLTKGQSRELAEIMEFALTLEEELDVIVWVQWAGHCNWMNIEMMYGEWEPVEHSETYLVPEKGTYVHVCKMSDDTWRANLTVRVDDDGKLSISVDDAKECLMHYAKLSASDYEELITTGGYKAL